MSKTRSTRQPSKVRFLKLINFSMSALVSTSDNLQPFNSSTPRIATPSCSMMFRTVFSGTTFPSILTT